jgi:5-methylcytosine-specific restriction endonuclease McrBC regulatory subunit McrC
MTDLLKRIEESQQRGEQLLRLVDGYDVSPILTADQQRILLTQPQEKLRLLGLSIQTELENGIPTYRIKSGAYVGTARFVAGRSFIDIVVEPKIGRAQLFHILDYCNRSLASHSEYAPAFASASSLTIVVIQYVVGAIRRFLNRFWFRDYRLQKETGGSHIRGRLLASEYLRDSYATLRWHQMPCEFFAFTPDTCENQILLAALNSAARILTLANSDDRKRLRGEIAQCRSILSDVTPCAVGVRDVEAIRYHAANIQFKGIHQLCRLLLGNSSVDLSPGQRLSFMAFGINMNDLFETYARRVLASAFGSCVISEVRQRQFALEGFEKSIKPDILIIGSNATVVGDAKNKLIERVEDLESAESDVRHPDLYQVVAYANHRDVRANSGLLIYPNGRSADAAFRSIGTVTGFNSSAGGALPVHICLLNMTHDPLQVVNETKRCLGPVLDPTLRE